MCSREGRFGGNQTGHGPVVLGDGDFLPLGDTMQKLGKMRLCLKRADKGAGAAETIGYGGHK